MIKFESRYAEAHKVQVQGLQLEKDEQERHLQVRHKKIVSAESTLIQKQQNEMSALRKKVETTEAAQI